ncbi:Hypothetical predicted protein [Octopus vulgaris]|uniref:Uncharacterized protein n=1 Tax=Octopus vulgaris TaxID=6645 RepID=A0AA36ALR9_OCTVU|nr:Hypothetical predicted protein [Octopus vulgaris]
MLITEDSSNNIFPCTGAPLETSKEEKWVDYISLLRFPVYLPAQDVLIEFQMEEGSANGMTFISNIAACCLDGIKLVSHLGQTIPVVTSDLLTYQKNLFRSEFIYRMFLHHYKYKPWNCHHSEKLE